LRAVLALAAIMVLLLFGAAPAQAAADFTWHVDHSTTDPVRDDNACHNSGTAYSTLEGTDYYLHFCVHLYNSNTHGSTNSYDTAGASINWYCVDVDHNDAIVQCEGMSATVHLMYAEPGSDEEVASWTSHCEALPAGFPSDCDLGNHSSALHEGDQFGPFNGAADETTPYPLYVKTTDESLEASYNSTTVGSATTLKSFGEDCWQPPGSGCNYP
jgi:hypothetical protein